MSEKKGHLDSQSDGFDEACDAFRKFCVTIARLRDPFNGCPWDLKQNHTSLRRYMIEEAYEAVRVMADADQSTEASSELCQELGDVLLQVVLNAQVASDCERFKIADVIRSIDTKMRRRHPHVFGTPEERRDREIESIKEKWETIKAGEKEAAGKNSEKNSERKNGFFDGINGYPATIEALEIGKRAAKINFDWSDPAEVLAKLLSEVEELKEEWESGNREALIAEIGDVYFSLAQLTRHLGLDPEVVALDGNRKFMRRFSTVEALASMRGVDITVADQATLEALWEESKIKNPR